MRVAVDWSNDDLETPSKTRVTLNRILPTAAISPAPTTSAWWCMVTVLSWAELYVDLRSKNHERQSIECLPAADLNMSPEGVIDPESMVSTVNCERVTIDLRYASLV